MTNVNNRGVSCTVGDITFPCNNPRADYEGRWTPTFNDRSLIHLTECWESSVMFSAREGWINTSAPRCLREQCVERNNSSYCVKRSGRTGWYWRFRCCKRYESLLRGSIICNGSLHSGNLLEIQWKIASRTPSSMISSLVHGRQTS